MLHDHLELVAGAITPTVSVTLYYYDDDKTKILDISVQLHVIHSMNTLTSLDINIYS